MAWLWVFLFIAPLVVLQSSAEELVFRGYLPQSLHHMLPGLLNQPILIALISSALFAALHWGNPDVMHSPWIAMAEFFVLSLAVSWLSLRLGGLEAAFALHSVNNCMLLLFFTCCIRWATRCCSPCPLMRTLACLGGTGYCRPFGADLCAVLGHRFVAPKPTVVGGGGGAAAAGTRKCRLAAEFF